MTYVICTINLPLYAKAIDAGLVNLKSIAEITRKAIDDIKNKRPYDKTVVLPTTIPTPPDLLPSQIPECDATCVSSLTKDSSGVCLDSDIGKAQSQLSEVNLAILKLSKVYYLKTNQPIPDSIQLPDDTVKPPNYTPTIMFSIAFLIIILGSILLYKMYTKSKTSN